MNPQQVCVLHCGRARCARAPVEQRNLAKQITRFEYVERDLSPFGGGGVDPHSIINKGDPGDCLYGILSGRPMRLEAGDRRKFDEVVQRPFIGRAISAKAPSRPHEFTASEVDIAPRVTAM